MAEGERDVRVCFVGDSYVAGVGDGSGLGWVGRLASHAHAAGLPLTVYNLGIRGHTAVDVAERLPDEVTRRVKPGTDTRVVLAYGLNDVALAGGSVRVSAADSLAATSRSLGWLAASRLPAIFVGPPTIGEAAMDSRSEALDLLLAERAEAHAVGYVSVFGRLANDPVWLKEVRAGDGAHPGSPGYQRYFEAVREPLIRFIGAS